jgi:hypothetical protein
MHKARLLGGAALALLLLAASGGPIASGTIPADAASGSMLPAVLGGALVDEDSQPVVGAAVELYWCSGVCVSDSNGPGRLFDLVANTVTGASGEFNLVAPHRGKYAVRVGGEDWPARYLPWAETLLEADLYDPWGDGPVDLGLIPMITALSSEQAFAVDQAWLDSHGVEADAAMDAQWSLLTTTVSDAFVDEYAGALIDGGVYYAGFKDAVPQQAADLLSDFPGDFRLSADLGFTRAEMLQTVSLIADVISKHLPEAVVEVAPVPMQPRVSVTVSPGTISGLPPTLVGKGLLRVAIDPASDFGGFQSSRENLGRLAVLIESKLPENSIQATVLAAPIDPAPPAVLVVGGKSLTSCTAGFTAAINGGVKGLFTAGHCSATQNYEGSNILTNLGSVYGSGGDGRVFRVATNHTVTKTFTAGGAIRTQTAQADPVVGNTIFKQGMTNGYGSSKVTKVDTCVTHTGGTNVCRVFRVAGTIVRPGDSGGPAFIGSVAYGLVSTGDATHPATFTHINAYKTSLKTSVYK